MKTNYEIRPVTNSFDMVLYYELARTKDDAIFYANENIENCMMQAWALGINYHDCTIR